MRVAFLAKQKPFAADAAALLRQHVSDADVFFGALGDPFPPRVLVTPYDYVISYISPWIIPGAVLRQTRRAAINLHPGPPDYPGIGCTNFAIYDGATEFGVTAHHMKEKVDSGAIIMVRRFPIRADESVFSLTERCYAEIYHAFMELVPYLYASTPLPKSQERWQRKPYTRKELNELCSITSGMSDDEVRRRVRATTYPNMPGAYIERAGIRFNAVAPNT